MDLHGYVLVYSVTSMKSFEVIQVLHDKLLDMVGKVQVPTVLVGNKKDLHMERVIKPEEGKKLADSWGAAFMESSAKENQTAVEVFKRIVLEMEKADGNAPSEEKKCAVIHVLCLIGVVVDDQLEVSLPGRSGSGEGMDEQKSNSEEKDSETSALEAESPSFQTMDSTSSVTGGPPKCAKRVPEACPGLEGAPFLLGVGDQSSFHASSLPWTGRIPPLPVL
ncbi:RHEB protein, partial [Polyodon spathula]|nr:RHEB protein [Polyodon spathula]